MENDYYSLSSILAENHKLPCTFTLDVPGLGYLEGTEADLAAGAKVELPLWVGPTLAFNEFVTFSVPTPFSARVRAALNASATALRLSNFVGQGGWWYRFGAIVAQIGDTLLGMLHTTFIARLPDLQDLAAHHASADHSVEAGVGAGESFRDGMEADERELFGVGQDSGRVVKGWYDVAWGKRR